jgi:hypothetical protein
MAGNIFDVGTGGIILALRWLQRFAAHREKWKKEGAQCDFSQIDCV